METNVEFDRQAIEFEVRVEQRQYAKALSIFEAMHLEDADSIPVRLWFEHAAVCDQVGRLDEALESVSEYIRRAGREGEHYEKAIRLSILVGDKLEEQNRATEAARQAEARKKAVLQRAARIAEEQAQAAVEIPRDPMKSGDHAPTMVQLPAGDLCVRHRSGEAACHVVDVSEFAISKFLVSVHDFRRFVEHTRFQTEAERKNTCNSFTREYAQRRATWKSLARDQTERHPVFCISILDAIEYTRWLGTQTGKVYRLPSAAERAYAFRAGLSINIARHEQGRYSSQDVRLYLQGKDAPAFQRLLGPAYSEPPAAYECSMQYLGPWEPLAVDACPPNNVGIVFHPLGVQELVQTCVVDTTIRGLLYSVMRDSDGGYDQLGGCIEVARTQGASLTWGSLDVVARRQRTGFDRTFSSSFSTGFRIVMEVER